MNIGRFQIRISFYITEQFEIFVHRRRNFPKFLPVHRLTVSKTDQLFICQIITDIHRREKIGIVKVSVFRNPGIRTDIIGQCHIPVFQSYPCINIKTLPGDIQSQISRIQQIIPFITIFIIRIIIEIKLVSSEIFCLQNIFHHRLISESCRHMIFIKPVIIGPVFIISLTILSIYPRFQGRRKSSAFIEKIIVIRTERYNVFIQTQEIPIDIVLVDPHFSTVHIPYDIVLLTLDNPPVRLVFICIRITQIPIQCPCRQIVDSRKLPTIGTSAAINIFCFFLNI